MYFHRAPYVGMQRFSAYHTISTLSQHYLFKLRKSVNQTELAPSQAKQTKNFPLISYLMGSVSRSNLEQICDENKVYDIWFTHLLFIFK